jgi:hypothetical protein
MARLVGGTNGNGVDANSGGNGDSGPGAGGATAHEEMDYLEDTMDVEEDDGEDLAPDEDLA